MVGEGGENIIAVASGANRAVRCDQVPDAMLGPGVLLVAQMEVPAVETEALIGRVRVAGGYVLLNLAPALAIEPEMLRQIDLVVANELEAATLGPDPARVAQALREALVVTRGAAGATAYLADGGKFSVPALPVVPVDTTGAGDTFVGVLAAGLDRGMRLEPALWRASAAAALACLARGAQAAMPDAAAIDDALTQIPRN
jgi:ribokinase